MEVGGDSPPGNPRHRTGFDPPTGQQKPELFDRVREPHALALPRQISSLPLTSRALNSEQTTRPILLTDCGGHLVGGPPWSKPDQDVRRVPSDCGADRGRRATGSPLSQQRVPDYS
jgi:hypothetical protein